jgi:hypothetical protein
MPDLEAMTPKHNLPLVGGAYDKRLLEQRSRLEFYYNDGQEESLMVFLPFFENPIITETKAANYATYNPIGRSSSLFAYTGAQARKFSLETTYTLPHLMRYEMGVDRFRRLIDSKSKASQRLLFTKHAEGSTKNLVGSPETASPAFKETKKYWDIVTQESFGVGLDTVQDLAVVGVNASLAALGFGGGFNQPTQEDQLPSGALDGVIPQEWEATTNEKNKAIDTLVFFINILRTSVSNDATNPIYGPPIVRIIHGTLYQNIPCICKSYNIEWQENMGYDLETLTPRRLKVRLELEELRVGRFDKFEPHDFELRDNVAGWESVISSPLTTDPGDLP